jgi:anti-sigma-K factor RskA
MKKIVNGIEVDCTAEEIAQREAEEAAILAQQPAVLAEQARLAEIEANISADTFGNPAKTLKQLSEMSWTDFNTWWGANVTTAAAAIVVLKRLTYFVLRRCRA